MRLKVETEWRQQRTARGKTSQRLVSSDVDEFEWPDGVAEFLASFLRDHPRIAFSGMEDFGQGGCVLDPVSLRCRAYGDCRHHHIESVREWIERRVDELKLGESVDFTGGGLKWVSITVTALADSDPDEDTGPAGRGPAVLRELLRLE